LGIISVSVNSEVPSIHLALQPALLGKPVNTLPPNTLHYKIPLVKLKTFSKKCTAINIAGLEGRMLC